MAPDVGRAKELYTQAGQSSNAGAAKTAKEYLASLSSPTGDSQASQSARVNKPSNADGWIGLLVTVVALGAVGELVEHWSSSSSGSDRQSDDASSSSSVPTFDYTPPSAPDWNWGTSSEPIAPIAPTRPDLYYPNEPWRPVNGDLTDPRIATR